MSHHDCNHNGPSLAGILAGAVIGGAIGAAVGILFAPSSGEETRAKIMKKGEEAWKKSKKDMEDFRREKIDPMLNNVSDEIKNKAESIKSKFNTKSK